MYYRVQTELLNVKTLNSANIFCSLTVKKLGHLSLDQVLEGYVSAWNFVVVKKILLARIIRYVLLAGNGACTFAPFNSTCVFLPPSFLVVKKVGLFSSWALLGSEYSEC